MKHILYIVLIVSLSGCGLFRKVHKEKALDKTETSSITKSDSSGVTIDKSVITIREKLDTVIRLPSKTIKQDVYLNMDSLVNGMTAVKNDLLDVRLILNPVTHILSVEANIKARQVPVYLDKLTIKQNDITQSGTLSKSKEDKSKEYHEAILVDKQPKITFWYIILVIGSIAVIVFFWFKFFR